ncbi:HAMP domain-containing protein [Marmoricola sp. URHA0025 HA25]
MDSEPEGSLGLWAVPRVVVVTQFVAGAVFLLMALVNLAGSEPSGWERFLGVAAALVAGMAFGVAGSLRALGRMVRRHMDAWHPDVPAPEARRTGVTPVER